MAAVIPAVRHALDETFDRLDLLCNCPEELLRLRPACADAWSIAEHLEHVALVNHFLLLTIAKGTATALRRARTQPIPDTESDLLPLAPFGDPAAFRWEPPGHMLPTGGESVADVRQCLVAQRERCRELLASMAGGEGRLCAFRMSVHSLGRLDMYQWLYFLAQHGRWHLEFLARRAG